MVIDLVHNHCDQVHHGLARVVSTILLEPLGFKDICVALPLKYTSHTRPEALLHHLFAGIRAF